MDLAEEKVFIKIYAHGWLRGPYYPLLGSGHSEEPKSEGFRRTSNWRESKLIMHHHDWQQIPSYLAYGAQHTITLCVLYTQFENKAEEEPYILQDIFIFFSSHSYQGGTQDKQIQLGSSSYCLVYRNWYSLFYPKNLRFTNDLNSAMVLNPDWMFKFLEELILNPNTFTPSQIN